MKERRKRRSAKDIKESIINAATHLIETEGFSNLTVTGIMRQAEIEPVQFYNRYDDLNRFIDEYVKKYDYWFSDIVKSQKQSSNDKELYINILIGLFQSLSGNKVMQELLKWELASNNETSQRTAQLRDANQGACTHPCRWKYSIVEETRPNEYMPVYENERGTYIFNSKDLCMIEHIPDLFDAGIDSFKIEGRMKTALYVATVARTYRKAIDDYKKSPELYQQNMPWYLDQISNCTYRQFTTGFFYGKPSDEAQIYDNNTYLKEYTYLGIVGGTNEEGLYRIEQRNKFSVGEQIEVMKPDGENIEVTVKRIVDEEGNEMESAPHPKQVLYIDLGHPLEMYDILRRKE